MMARGAGKIVNVSSTAGFMTMGSYSAIKAWVTSYTEGLAVELKGTGIGLWLSSTIIQEHRGRIQVRSRMEPGHSGTCISILLPVE